MITRDELIRMGVIDMNELREQDDRLARELRRLKVLESTPAQSLAEIRAEAVIEAIEKCNANAQEEDNGERLIYVSDLIDHANRIKEG